MHFGNAAKYAEYLAAVEKSRDGKATEAERETATALVARLEQEKKENLSAQGTHGISCLFPLTFFVVPRFPRCSLAPSVEFPYC